MTLTEKGDDGEQVSLIDLTRLTKIGSLSAGATRHCVCVGTEAVAYVGAGAEVLVQSLDRGNAPREVRLQCAEPSCLQVLNTEAGKHLLAVGTVEGRVHVWELHLQAHEWSYIKMLELVAHEGLVTGLTFLSDKKLVSSSSDRSIAVINFGETDDKAAQVERRLVLTLRCQGMKIEGLRTESERALLAKHV